MGLRPISGNQLQQPPAISIRRTVVSVAVPVDHVHDQPEADHSHAHLSHHLPLQCLGIELSALIGPMIRGACGPSHHWPCFGRADNSSNITCDGPNIGHNLLIR